MSPRTIALLNQAGIPKPIGPERPGPTVPEPRTFLHELAPYLLEAPVHPALAYQRWAVLRAADAALLVVEGVEGLRRAGWLVQEVVEAKRPLLLFIEEGRDAFLSTEEAWSLCQDTDSSFGFVLPVLAGPESPAELFDLLAGERVNDEGRVPFDACGLTPSLLEELKEHTENLDELIACCDDALCERYMEAQSLDPAARLAGLQGALARRELAPILQGSLRSGPGLDLLLEALASWLPRRAPASAEPAAAFAFHSHHHAGIPPWTWVRVTRGTLAQGQEIRLGSTGAPVLLESLSTTLGERTLLGQRAMAGALTLVRSTVALRTGDLLYAGEPPAEEGAPPTLHPGYRMALEVLKGGEQLEEGLAALQAEDPSLHHGQPWEFTEPVLAGQGPTHLAWALEHLAETHDVRARPRLTIPRYLAELRARAKGQGYCRTLDSVAGLDLEVVPHTRAPWGHPAPSPAPGNLTPWGARLDLSDDTRGGVLDMAHFGAAIREGVLEALACCAPLGVPVADCQVRLVDARGNVHVSSQEAFRRAAHRATRAALALASPTLIEPVHRADLVLEEPALEGLRAALAQARGQELGLERRHGLMHLVARIPLAELLLFQSVFFELGVLRMQSSLGGYEPRLSPTPGEP